jgi:hypothetical protein
MCDNNPAVAAIQYALKTDEGLQFLRLWNEGEFNDIRKEWTDCPKECFIGAEVGSCSCNEKPILGQEAICPDGLGRVVDFSLEFPNTFVQVQTYVKDRSCKWGVENVLLIDPRR